LHADECPKATFSPKKFYLLIFSLLFSSAISGMILYGTFMFELYKIIGLETEQEVLQKVNGELTKLDAGFLKLSRHIPQAVLLIAGLVILSRVISVLATLVRHWSFTVSRTDSQFFVKSGVLIKRRHIINRSKVNLYDLRQTFLMKIFKICSVTLDCTGYGKSRREISALIPITTYREMNASLKMLVPDLPKPRPEIKTGRKDVPRFITMPLVMCALPPLILRIIRLYFDRWHSEINSLMVIVMIPMIWMVIVKTAAAFNTSVGFNENGCSFSYCRLYQFHKIFLPKANISKIRITRNPFQLLNKTCTLWIYTCGEKEKYHKMKFMPYEEIKKICLREGYIMFE
jgi:putative membrane protein